MMRQMQAATAATALTLIVLTILTFLPLVDLGSPPAHANPLRQAPGASPCTVTADKIAAPGVIGLGEVANVNFSIRASCPDSKPLHLVMVLDASGSMTGDPSRQMKDAMKKLVDQLDLASHPSVKVGVVEFGGNARTLCQLTNTGGQAKSCIGRVGATGGSCIDCGIREGLRVVLNGRRNVPAQSTAEVMLIVSDGANNSGCGPVLQAARQAKDQGIMVVTVCVSAACDAQCLRDAASSARYFYQLSSPAEFVALIDRLVKEFAGPLVIFQRITIVDELPANMPIVPDSIVPAPSEVVGGQVTWTWTFVPAGWVSATLQVQPQALGQWPTNIRAYGEFLDHFGRSGLLTFTVPSVIVQQATSTATPTALPATVTPTPGPTSVIPTQVPPTVPPPPGPAPTATPAQPKVCPNLTRRVPASVIAHAVGNAPAVGGWGKRCNPSQPPGPWNGTRTWLSLRNNGAAYNPLYNSVEWKCGCS